QNKDALAVQLKLNEIVAAIEGASNRLIDVEDLSESELERLRAFYRELAHMSKRDTDLLQSHSVEEAGSWHRRKHRSKHGAQGPQGSAPDASSGGKPKQGE